MKHYLTTYKSSRHAVYSCKYHIIFCPKYRKKVLVGEVESRFKEILEETTAMLRCELIEYEVMPDHVHILVDITPDLGVKSYISRIKGRSARLLRSEFPWLKTKLPCLWTNSYFVSTVGGATLDSIKQYVQNQKTN